MRWLTTCIRAVPIAGILTIAGPAQAYEEDTHFQATYVICRASGLTDSEALTVAAANQGMDDSSGTVANGGVGGIIPNVPEESLWHALDEDGKMGPKGILKRKEELFSIALSRKTFAEKLFYLGVFFHYQQDTWAHRHHYDGKPHTYDEFTTYNTPFGHARHGHQPDRPPFDPEVALWNFEDGIRYVRAFIKALPDRKPNPFFDGYEPKLGRRDSTWSDKRKGKYFHMLTAEGDVGTARRFLTELIRAQIDCYLVSKDANPFFFIAATADKADLDKTRAALDRVCADYKAQLGETITVPNQATKEKQGFMNLTTKQVLAGMGK